MKKFRVALTVLLLLLFTLGAQAESLLGGKMTVKIPKGFKKATTEMIKAKFPGKNPPTLVYGNSSGSVTFAAKSTALSIPDTELPKFQQAMRQNLQKARPKAQFLTDEIITINDQKWVHYVFISQASDGPIRNEMLVASKNGEAFIINLNSTQADYRFYSSKLDASRNSIRLK